MDRKENSYFKNRSELVSNNSLFEYYKEPLKSHLIYIQIK